MVAIDADAVCPGDEVSRRGDDDSASRFADLNGAGCGKMVDMVGGGPTPAFSSEIALNMSLSGIKHRLLQGL